LHLPIPNGNVDLAGLASGGFFCLLVSSVKTPRSLENPPAGEEGECAPHLVLWFVPDRPGKGKRGLIGVVGVDTTLEVIRYARNNANRQFWAKRFKEFGNHTMEMTVLGQRLIMTDEPENIKAILATQFHDFGECVGEIEEGRG
jgi:hypothetical protein